MQSHEKHIDYIKEYTHFPRGERAFNECPHFLQISSLVYEYRLVYEFDF